MFVECRCLRVIWRYKDLQFGKPGSYRSVDNTWSRDWDWKDMVLNQFPWSKWAPWGFSHYIFHIMSLDVIGCYWIRVPWNSSDMSSRIQRWSMITTVTPKRISRRLAVIQATGKYKAWPWGPANPSPISDVLLAFKGSNILWVSNFVVGPLAISSGSTWWLLHLETRGDSSLHVKAHSFHHGQITDRGCWHFLEVIPRDRNLGNVQVSHVESSNGLLNSGMD